MDFCRKQTIAARMNLRLVAIYNKYLPAMMVVYMNLTHCAYDIYKVLLALQQINFGKFPEK